MSWLYNNNQGNNQSWLYQLIRKIIKIIKGIIRRQIIFTKQGLNLNPSLPEPGDFDYNPLAIEQGPIQIWYATSVGRYRWVRASSWGWGRCIPPRVGRRVDTRRWLLLLSPYPSRTQWALSHLGAIISWDFGSTRAQISDEELYGRRASEQAVIVRGKHGAHTVGLR
jgi:hypothetical protein